MKVWNLICRNFSYLFLIFKLKRKEENCNCMNCINFSVSLLVFFLSYVYMIEINWFEQTKCTFIYVKILTFCTAGRQKTYLRLWKSAKGLKLQKSDLTVNT